MPCMNYSERKKSRNEDSKIEPLNPKTPKPYYWAAMMLRIVTRSAMSILWSWLTSAICEY